ncbi:ABC transporter permease, partial [Rhizobiaceae sp. 2RAB30]
MTLAVALPAPITEGRPGRLRRLRLNLPLGAGLALLAVMLLSALAAPLLAPSAPTAVDLTAVRLPPSAAHWFGT